MLKKIIKYFFVLLIGIALGYAWHYNVNVWNSRILYYYFYGQSGDIKEFKDK